MSWSVASPSPQRRSWRAAVPQQARAVRPAAARPACPSSGSMCWPTTMSLQSSSRGATGGTCAGCLGRAGELQCLVQLRCCSHCTRDPLRQPPHRMQHCSLLHSSIAHPSPHLPSATPASPLLCPHLPAHSPTSCPQAGAAVPGGCAGGGLRPGGRTGGGAGLQKGQPLLQGERAAQVGFFGGEVFSGGVCALLAACPVHEHVSSRDAAATQPQAIMSPYTDSSV